MELCNLLRAVCQCETVESSSTIQHYRRAIDGNGIIFGPARYILGAPTYRRPNVGARKRLRGTVSDGAVITVRLYRLE